MKTIHAQATATIPAPPSQVYAVFRDYEKSHPAILPKPYFADLQVEKGGQGAGTQLRVQMKVMCVEANYHLTVSEPERGRRLVETDEKAGVHTTFLVEPLNGGGQSRVTISIDSKASPGLKGWLERRMNPPITRRILKKELQLVADYLAAQ